MISFVVWSAAGLAVAPFLAMASEVRLHMLVSAANLHDRFSEWCLRTSKPRTSPVRCFASLGAKLYCYTFSARSQLFICSAVELIWWPIFLTQWARHKGLQVSSNRAERSSLPGRSQSVSYEHACKQCFPAPFS
jgi:hypothetical protein